MSNSTKQDKKERQAIMKAMNIKMTIIQPPEYHKTECSICFKKIHKGGQKTLQCGHMFHWSCIRHWALKKDVNTETYEYIKPMNNRRIHLFKLGDNLFTCPCCRIEYTSDSFTHDIKRVLAKNMLITKVKISSII